jgi:hypothetical protein
VISGKLSNDTIWWLSTNGQKIWIESKDLEKEKFKEKGYRTTDDRIFYLTNEMGELTTSRLESRKRKDAWIIKVDAMLDVYPELIMEIKTKEIEEKKKKRESVSSRNKREIRREFKAPSIENKDNITESNESIIKNNEGIIESNEENLDNSAKKHVGDYFDINRPYITWIKEEMNKSEKEEIIISYKDLKSKMGEDFEKMDDFRIFYGLNKILPSIGMILESKYAKRQSMAVIKKS